MAVVATYSHQFMLECLRAEHQIDTGQASPDTLKIILMGSAFAFDPDTHSTYATVSASEIAAGTGTGYTVGGTALTNVLTTIDTSADQVDIAADNITWTATGGAILTTGSAVVYNDSHANKTVVMCIDFGADYDTATDKLFQVNFSNGFGVVDNA